MISRRIGWTGAGGLWGFKFLVLSMALLVVMGAGQKLAAADRPRPGTEKSKSEGRAGFIDRLLESSWKKAGVNPAKPATDEEYLRRAYLDLLGRIPDVQEARAFLQTRETDKREKLVDFLLEHADYPKNSFRPIDTSAPGVKICEHMPRMAKQMHHMNIIRSLDSKEGNHDRGTYLMHSGYAPNPTVVHPGWGSIAAYKLGEQLKNFDLPHCVAINEPGMGAGFLGMSFSPFVIQNPNAPIANLKPPADVDAQRFDRRLDMLGQVENDFIAQRRSHLAVDHKAVCGKTIRMMNSKYKDIFNLQSESAAVREAYGHGSFGSGCLMARRLVEQGVTYVEVSLRGWDTHANNFETLSKRLLPELDQGMSALVADLAQRGLLDSTLIVWMGEFGRTPRINQNAGRHHWPRSWSVAIGGGGIKAGQTVGATDKDGVDITDRPVGVMDLIATMTKSMGIDIDT